MKNELFDNAVSLLKELISTPSFSKEEKGTAKILFDFLKEQGCVPVRKGNNVWCLNKNFNPEKPTLLLNSHHDTVRPNAQYSRNPFSPDILDGKLFGLGSNDAGGALVSLMAAFLHFNEMDELGYNLVMAATAEEEISGTQGIESILSDLPPLDCALVGEPTSSEIAVAEKGLLVLDCFVKGKAGHAAREEGENAIYKALPDLEWFRTFAFPKGSAKLGRIKMSVTVIEAGKAHNQVPDECRFTVDVRVTDVYTLEEVLKVVRDHVSCEVKPRSMRIKPSAIDTSHPLVLAAKNLRMKLYGSPTTSDQALIPVPSIKMGPGDSARSHSADEFIYLQEIREGIKSYIHLLEVVLSSKLTSHETLAKR